VEITFTDIIAKLDAAPDTKVSLERSLIATIDREKNNFGFMYHNDSNFYDL
jgi:hypothetical protein